MSFLDEILMCFSLDSLEKQLCHRTHILMSMHVSGGEGSEGEREMSQARKEANEST